MAQQSAHVQGAAVCTHVAKLLLSFSIETLHGCGDAMLLATGKALSISRNEQILK